MAQPAPHESLSVIGARRYCWIALLPAIAAAEPVATAPPVVVTATRSGQAAADLPVSIDRIEADAIRSGQRLINLTDSLARIPGIVAQNRQNYAQDLQISSRGFGARSTFGVRGLRLYADGIPATMPDGQGQVSHFDLASAEVIEVLRGPFSALYGNSSGGVIAMFTENGRPGLALAGDAGFGSYGERRYGLKASGQQGAVNYVLSGNRFTTDGYREHSAANRTTQNAKLRVTLDPDSMLTVVGNAVRMHEVQDPLGLTRAQAETDARGVDPSAILFNTRKSVDQGQIGLRYERTLGRDDNIDLMLYGGQRATNQFLAVPAAAQSAPSSAGGVIDLDRNYWGADLRWTRRTTLAGAPLEITAGLAYDRLDEDRRGIENFVGPVVGVQGRLRRNEFNTVSNVDQYLQAQWQPGTRWLLLAGVRNSNVQVNANDRYIAAGNADDSGAVHYQALNPVLGATFKFSTALNLYASYGSGFETPTLNELSYRSSTGTVGGLNFGLNPARSVNLEVGAKLRIGEHLRANLALFHVDTRDELTVLSNTGGRAVFQNAGKTRRDGIELRMENAWDNGISAQLAYSFLRAVYADAFCNGSCSATTRVSAGNRLPGVPRHSLYGELAWRHAPAGFTVALEGRYTDKVFVDDLNSDAASGYVVANLRAVFEQRSGPWQFTEFARIDNIADRRYIGSVIVNESNQRFFEPAPGRNYFAGVRVTRKW
jgi:iron complex outermembrane receptor protein